MTSEFATELILRLLGGLCGTVLALALTPPRTRSGFIQRALVGTLTALVFTGQVRSRISWFSADIDGLLSAAATIAFVSWQALTIAKVAIVRWLKKHDHSEDDQAL